MRTRTPTDLRRGATVVENAIVLPFTFFLIFALVVGSMGIFRYQEVSSLAREGARYASTHGYQYRKDAGLPMGTPEEWKKDIYDNAIAPRMVALDPSRLSVSVSWPDVVNQPGKPDNWPGSKVDVTVSYDWFPEMYLIGPIRLTSTSSMPITN
ncbi:MAG TPA: TadE/TadG family type IV pilus assembly protein [Gemmataceae bacterium]|nr:TadE/TadG family type IV pilus assembly protein [Gemmataceae bacterium]